MYWIGCLVFKNLIDSFDLSDDVDFFVYVISSLQQEIDDYIVQLKSEPSLKTKPINIHDELLDYSKPEIQRLINQMRIDKMAVIMLARRNKLRNQDLDTYYKLVSEMKRILKHPFYGDAYANSQKNDKKVRQH